MKKLVKVRNHEYSRASTAGAEVEAVDKYCPCRNCYVISWETVNGKDVFFCKNLRIGNCKPSVRKPYHKITRIARNNCSKCIVCGQSIRVIWSPVYQRYLVVE